MTIQNYINRLLLEHDCVIIPGFGGFVGNYKSSAFNPVQHRFSPPSKDISFNKNLVHNDGLLAHCISKEEKISYEEANNRLKIFSAGLNASLARDKKIEIKKIGHLTTDEHQNIHFRQDQSENYLADSFGLTLIHARITNNDSNNDTAGKTSHSLRQKTAEIKFEDRSPEEKRVVVQGKKKIIPGERIRKYISYSAILIPLLFFIAWIPFNLDRISSLGKKAKNYNYSNLIPFIDKALPVYMERNVTFKINFPESLATPFPSFPDTQNFAKVPVFENDSLIVRLREMSNEVLPEKSMENFRFHIIGGCFEYYENAEKLVNQLRGQGFNAAIVDKHHGLYRVCYQSFSKRSGALQLLAKIQNNSPKGAWLLVK